MWTCGFEHADPDKIPGFNPVQDVDAALDMFMDDLGRQRLKGPPWPYELLSVERFVDADTAELWMRKQIGFGKWALYKELMRPIGIDCPEKRDPGHDEALALFEQLVSIPGSRVDSYGKGNFGRWLCNVILPDGQCAWEIMIKARLTKNYRR